MKTFSFVLFTVFVFGIGATLAAENGTEVTTMEPTTFKESTVPTIDPNITTTVSPNMTTTTEAPKTTTVPTTTTSSTTSTTLKTTSTTPETTTQSTTEAPTTTTPSPNTTTLAPTTTTPSTNTTTVSPTSTVSPKPAPIPHPSKWSLTSFIGGIVFGLGMIAIGFVAWKFYKARNERNYHTL